MSKRAIVFMTFADTHMLSTLRRIESEARKSEFFDKILIYTENDFDEDYWNKYHNFIIANKRGYGYWIWKSYLISKTLKTMKDGDFLIYLDGGCEINKNGRKRFLEYLDLASQSSLGILGFGTGQVERKYVKGDTVDYLCLRDNPILDTEQMMGGILVICKTDNSVSLIEKWEEIVHDNLHLVDDEPSKVKNSPDFVENRHDQSILSLLCKKYGGGIILPGTEVDVWPRTNRNWRKLKKFPFLAIRNRTGVPRLGDNKLIIMLNNMRWDFENSIETSKIKLGHIKGLIKGMRNKEN